MPANAAPANTLNVPTAAPNLLSAAGPAIGPAAADPIHHLTPPRSVPRETSSDRFKVARCPWTDETDYILLKEVVVAKAHMSPWGKMTERFRVVTNNFNANPRATFKNDHKHAKDRFKLLAKSFEAFDKKRATKTGTEEVPPPMELLLVDVVEEMNGFNERTAPERKERTAAEEELVKNGEQVRRLAMATRGEGPCASTLTISIGSGCGGAMEPSPTLEPSTWANIVNGSTVNKANARLQRRSPPANGVRIHRRSLSHELSATSSKGGPTWPSSGPPYGKKSR